VRFEHPDRGARTFAGITREHFSACAEQLGVNPRAASRLLEQLTSTIVPAADALIEEFQAIRVPRRRFVLLSCACCRPSGTRSLVTWSSG
jgi:hypothetical protein